MTAKAKLKHFNISDIIVGERFRKDLGDIEDLMKAIEQKGLLQPITISEKNELLAGGRRLEACTRLGFKTIPVLIRETEDELDLREVELMENVFRKDFTWQEEAALVLSIDRLMSEKDPNWSGRKTAELLDKSTANTARKIAMGKALEVLPELGDYKTADDAQKVLKKMEEEVITQELVKRQRERVAIPAQEGGKFDADRGIKDMLKRADSNYQIGDAFEGMAKLRTNGHIQFIECDPPYGIDLTEQKGGKDSSTSTVTGYKEVEADAYPAFLKKLAEELYRIAGRDCWLVFWYGPTWHHQVLTSLRDAGWLVDDIPAIWSKGSGQTLQPELYLARTYEPFFICRKGKPILFQRGRSNVFMTVPTPPTLKYHPTERPVHLIKDILRTFTTPNHIVFVPFLGSGATLRACYDEGMAGFGFDLDGKYKDKFLLAVEKDAQFAVSMAARSKNSDD